MAYDTGRIARDLQAEFRMFRAPDRKSIQGEKNTATPEHLAALLIALSNLTTDLAARRQRQGLDLFDPAMAAWDSRLTAWRQRLANYQTQVAKAPPGDRADVLWSVTAPLLLGFFGGPDSTDPQRPMDAITPFSLANQIAVDEAWRQAALDAFTEDLAESAKNVGEVTIGIGAGAAVAIGIAVLVIARGRRSRRR